MNEWRLAYTKQAKKDAKKIASAGLKQKVQELLGVLRLLERLDHAAEPGDPRHLLRPDLKVHHLIRLYRARGQKRRCY